MPSFFLASCDLSLIFSVGIPVGSSMEPWHFPSSPLALLQLDIFRFLLGNDPLQPIHLTIPPCTLLGPKLSQNSFLNKKWEKGETQKKSTTCWPISIRFSSGFDQQASLCTFRSEFVAEMAKDCKPRPTTALGWSGSFTHGHLVWNIASVHTFPWNMCGAQSPSSVHYRWLFLPWVREILSQWYLNVYLSTYPPTHLSMHIIYRYYI